MIAMIIGFIMLFLVGCAATNGGDTDPSDVPVVVPFDRWVENRVTIDRAALIRCQATGKCAYFVAMPDGRLMRVDCSDLVCLTEDEIEAVENVLRSYQTKS